MDYFDIFFSHGIVGAIIIIGIYLYILYKVLSTDRKIDFENYMIKLSIFLILLLSFFTGHIITAPAVSIIAVILILDNMQVSKLKKKGKKKKIKEVI